MIKWEAEPVYPPEGLVGDGLAAHIAQRYDWQTVYGQVLVKGEWVDWLEGYATGRGSGQSRMQAAHLAAALKSHGKVIFQGVPV